MICIKNQFNFSEKLKKKYVNLKEICLRMKKKKESEDILKQFYSNLSLLSPESFFFNRQLTKLLLPYIQKFIKSGDKCDFGFRIKNESSCELTDANHV